MVENFDNFMNLWLTIYFYWPFLLQLISVSPLKPMHNQFIKVLYIKVLWSLINLVKPAFTLSVAIQFSVYNLH